ncbi:MAG: hypothetical protein GX755_05490 [Syntrophomonadaceae bacterium]|nr:hypothetical protein [Syntrophomonadaceae bacterium]
MKKINNKKLLYYTYFLLSDLKIVQNLWKQLTGQEFRVSANKLTLLNSLPLLIDQVQVDNLDYSVFIYGNYLILEMLRETEEGFQTAITELEATVIATVTLIDDPKARLGETIILVSDNWLDSTEIVHQEVIETDSLFGPLHFVKTLNDEERHYYSVNTTLQIGEGLTGLRRFLPLMDKKIFIHNAKMRYIRQRTSQIINEADAIEQTVSQILLSSNAVRNNQPLTDVLEIEIEHLSKNYGILASYYRLLRESQGILDNSLILVTREARRIYGGRVQVNLQDYLAVCKNTTREVIQASERVNLIMGEIKAAIEVIRTQVDLLRSKESVELQHQFKKIMDQNTALQEKSLSLQVAAGFVEFIVIAYYSFSFWKYQSDPVIFDRIPGPLTFLVACAFAGVSVICTHQLAHERRFTKGLALSTAVIIALLALMAVLSSGLLF